MAGVLSPEAGQKPVNFREPLPLEQVPIPPGYDRRLMDPAYKAIKAAEHKRLVRRVLLKRAEITARGADDPKYRAHVLELCRRDPFFFVDYFCWTYDDRFGVDEPFVLYEFQRKKIVLPYLDMCATTGRNRWTGCKEKSRGVGWTWVELALRVWSWLFKDNWSILIGSVYEEDVDDGGQEATHESLFGKIRYILDNLPKWFRDEMLGPYWKRDSYNKRLLLKNPLRPRNVLVGKHFGVMFGRSKRFREVLGDEIAYATAMANADTSLKQTTNLFMGGSTPYGEDTFHAQLMHGDLLVHRETIHWSEHPELDLDWYNEQRQHMTDEAIASELDINYEGSVGSRVLSEVTAATHFIFPEKPDPNVLDESGRHVWDGTLYADTLPLHAVIDPGISDALACIWVQEDRLNQEWRIVDFVQVEDRAIDWIVPFLVGEVPESTYRGDPWPHSYNEVEHKIIARHKLWRPPAEVFGDHYGTTRSMTTGGSAYDELARYGVWVCPVKIEDNLQAISWCQLWFRHVRVSGHLAEQRNGNPSRIPTFKEVLSLWRYKVREEGAGGAKPQVRHDRYCHAGDCCKMYAQQVDLPDARQLPVAAGRGLRQRGSPIKVSKRYRSPR